MHVISEVQTILAGLRADNRGVQLELEDVADRLKELAPKLKDEYEALKSAGVFKGLSVIVGDDGLPVPDSALADYKRAGAQLDKLIGKAPEPAADPAPEAPAPAADPAPEAPAPAADPAPEAPAA